MYRWNKTEKRKYIKNENFQKQQVGYNFWRYIRVEKKCFSLPAMSHDNRNILDCGLKNINFFLAEGENKWFAVEWNQQPGFTINLSFIVIGSFGIRVLRWQNLAVSLWLWLFSWGDYMWLWEIWLKPVLICPLFSVARIFSLCKTR